MVPRGTRGKSVLARPGSFSSPALSTEGRPVDAFRERRRATRVPTSLQARLTTSEGASHALEVDDLSIVGLHGRAAVPLATGLACRVELATESGSVEARGTIVRSRERELALRFEHLPYESFERLKAFLLANAADPAVIADELTDRLSFLEESA